MYTIINLNLQAKYNSFNAAPTLARCSEQVKADVTGLYKSVSSSIPRFTAVTKQARVNVCSTCYL